MELTVRVRQEDGSYWADVQELPGCFASGDSLDELATALAEAIELYNRDEDDLVVEREDTGPAQPSMQIDEMKVLI